MKTLSVLLSLVLAVVLWGYLGFAVSADSLFFNTKLRYYSFIGASKVDLRDLVLGDWETVCQSDGYDGAVYVEKYNKWFPPSGYMQDGYWGLIFIFHDGSYKTATGKSIVIGVNGCAEREKALLIRKEGYQGYYLPEESRMNGYKYR